MKGTEIRHCINTSTGEQWWDLDSEEAEQSDRLDARGLPIPPFPVIPPHVISALSFYNWPKPWVREEDRKY